ncbi:MAG: DUF4162 domain-containing protein, partial [Chloroflexota bacterium]
GRIVADLPTHELLNRYAEDRYEIRLDGSSELLESVLPNCSRVVADDGTMRLLLPTTDDDELHQALGQVRRAGARLLSVEQVRPDLEEVFMRLVKEG